MLESPTLDSCVKTLGGRALSRVLEIEEVMRAGIIGRREILGVITSVSFHVIPSAMS